MPGRRFDQTLRATTGWTTSTEALLHVRWSAIYLVLLWASACAEAFYMTAATTTRCAWADAEDGEPLQYWTRSDKRPRGRRAASAIRRRRDRRAVRRSARWWPSVCSAPAAHEQRLDYSGSGNGDSLAMQVDGAECKIAVPPEPIRIDTIYMRETLDFQAEKLCHNLRRP